VPERDDPSQILWAWTGTPLSSKSPEKPWRAAHVFVGARAGESHTPQQTRMTQPLLKQRSRFRGRKWLNLFLLYFLSLLLLLAFILHSVPGQRISSGNRLHNHILWFIARDNQQYGCCALAANSARPWALTSRS
jgi:ABC-type phosphate/phosphonate transport system permease subunit